MKIYYEPVYKAWITVFYEPNEKKAQAKIEKTIGEPLENMRFGSEAKTIEYIAENGGQRIIVWLRKKSMKNLVHELVHVVEYVFGIRRIPFALESSENIAYYMEHLFDVFEEVVTKKK